MAEEDEIVEEEEVSAPSKLPLIIGIVGALVFGVGGGVAGMMLLGPSADYANAKSTLESLQSEHPELNLVAFSNGPRKYVLRVLREMGLDEIFPERMVFGVDDILPYCKPEPDSFKCIFERVGDLVGKEIVADQFRAADVEPSDDMDQPSAHRT